MTSGTVFTSDYLLRAHCTQLHGSISLVRLGRLEGREALAAVRISVNMATAIRQTGRHDRLHMCDTRIRFAITASSFLITRKASRQNLHSNLIIPKSASQNIKSHLIRAHHQLLTSTKPAPSQFPLPGNAFVKKNSFEARAHLYLAAVADPESLAGPHKPKGIELLHV